jgi:hypothetical protein
LQTPGRDVLGDELSALHHNACTCQRRIPDAETVVDLKTALDVDVHFAFRSPFARAREMRVTSIAFPRGVEEAKEAGLTLAPSERVGVPRIAQAPVSMECTLMQEVLLGGFSLVLGQILLVHVQDEAVMDRGRQHIDANKLDLIGRMEGAWYTKTTDRFEMPPIALSDWRARTVADVVS